MKKAKIDLGIPTWEDFTSNEPTANFLRAEAELDLNIRKLVDALYSASKNDADCKKASHYASMFALMNAASKEGWTARRLRRAMVSHEEMLEKKQAEKALKKAETQQVEEENRQNEGSEIRQDKEVEKEVIVVVEESTQDTEETGEMNMDMTA